MGGKILVERTIVSGRVVEKSVFWKNKEQVKRCKKLNKSVESKIDSNKNSCIKKLAREINSNFHYKDTWLMLDHRDKDISLDGAKKLLIKFIRNIKNGYKKLNGRDLKYIYITSDKKSDSDDKARVHHHIIMDRVGLDLIEKYWEEGDIGYNNLRNQRDYTPLAAYIIKNSRFVEKQRKWVPSKNLVKPIEYVEEVRRKKEIPVPNGCSVNERVTYSQDSTGRSEYLRYEIIEEDKVKLKKVLKAVRSFETLDEDRKG